MPRWVFGLLAAALLLAVAAIMFSFVQSGAMSNQNGGPPRADSTR